MNSKYLQFYLQEAGICARSYDWRMHDVIIVVASIAIVLLLIAFMAGRAGLASRERGE